MSRLPLEPRTVILPPPSTLSRAIEDSCQLKRVFAFALESAANGSERLGQRKNVTGDEQVGVFRPYGMPINAFGGNRNFGHQVGPRESDSFRC